MKHLIFIILYLLLLPLCACEKAVLEVSDGEDARLPLTPEDRFSKVDSTEWVYVIPDESIVTFTGIEAVKRRAQQMALIAWMPKGGSIPSRYGVYGAGTTYYGVPYSLAIKTDTHVGTQTSLYTFITAVDNPGSVLYTEDLRRFPYNGFDCAPYYGSTCSNSVMYALGIEPPFYTYTIPALSGIKKSQVQSADDVEPCDILLKSGHVVLVYEVSRGADGKLKQVCIFETTSDQGHDTWFRAFTADEFKVWWKKGEYVRYQYKYLNDVVYTSSPLTPLSGETRLANYRPLEVCTSLGDCVTYWRGQDVKITYMAKGYKTIVVFKDEEFYSEVPISYPTTTLSDLPCGEYKVRLSDSEGYYGSHFTRFEIIDAQVSGFKSEMIRISFSSEQASPRYVCICNGMHDPYRYYTFSDADRKQGYFEIPSVQGDRSTHYKVYFKGKYNTISTVLKSF